MKNLISSSLATLLVLTFQSCSKDNSDKQTSNTSEAKSVNDNNLAKASITIDVSTKDTLTSTYPFTSGQAITNASYTGRISSMTFSVNANGTNPNIVSITIQGHSNATEVIVKENSTQVAMCYEGTYTGKTSTGTQSSGTFNCISWQTRS